MCLAPNSDNFGNSSDLLEVFFFFCFGLVLFFFLGISFRKKAVLYLGLGPCC